MSGDELFKNLSTLPGFNFTGSPAKPSSAQDTINIKTNITSGQDNITDEIYMSFLTFIDNTRNNSSRKRETGSRIHSKKNKKNKNNKKNKK